MQMLRSSSSEMMLEEFFAKLGMEETWASFRFNILGPTKSFFIVIGVLILLFMIGSKTGSKSLQVLSAIIFLIFVCLKLMIL